jgi:RNA polymerase sigma factor (sigma-70 family)
MKSNKDFERIVRDNEKLVHHVAKKYKGLDQYDDLVQEGMIGLIKAIKRFDSSLGYAFSSYAESQYCL